MHEKGVVFQFKEKKQNHFEIHLFVVRILIDKFCVLNDIAIMKFRKGDRVEVFEGTEGASGYWHPAEIISCYGLRYVVRYDCSIVDKVLRKFIRPSPPLVLDWYGLEAGDLVEVFEDGVWRSARILKVVGGNGYLVRKLGFTKESQVHKVNIRMRQLWKEEKWIVLQKDIVDDGELNRTALNVNRYQKVASPLQHRNLYSDRKSSAAVLASTGFQQSYVVSSRSLKRRSPFSSSLIDTVGNSMTPAARKEGSHKKVRSGCPYSLPKKVDAAARSTPVNCCYESDTDICSVGSCSITSFNTCKLPTCPLAGFSQNSGKNSDTESLGGREDEEEIMSQPLEGDMVEIIHRVEFQAYYSTLEAFHSSGPLSWEREALLADLRIYLHISNDEYLSALKELNYSCTRPVGMLKS